MDQDVVVAVGVGATALCGVLCTLSLLDKTDNNHCQALPKRSEQKVIKSSRGQWLSRSGEASIVGLKDLLYCRRGAPRQGVLSRSHRFLTAREMLDQICLLQQVSQSESNLIAQLRMHLSAEREQRLFAERSAEAEKQLRREVEEALSMYRDEVNRLKQSNSTLSQHLSERDSANGELQMRLEALESILKLLSPESTPQGGESNTSMASLISERDLLQQENEELRKKLLDERRRGMEEKERLERQIAQYNYFLMMGGGPSSSAFNSPSASPSRMAPETPPRKFQYSEEEHSSPSSSSVQLQGVPCADEERPVVVMQPLPFVRG